MFVIKNVKTGKFAKHTGETDSGGYYVEYPWELVDSSEEAQQYTSHEHANEVAFWHLDNKDKWLVVDTTSKAEYEITTGRYFP